MKLLIALALTTGVALAYSFKSPVLLAPLWGACIVSWSTLEEKNK